MTDTLRDRLASLVEPGKLTCDTRDPKGIEADIKRMGVSTLCAALPVGDYASITRRGLLWVLERKEAKDFLNCLSDREGFDRIYDQVRRMLDLHIADHIFWLPEGLILPGSDGCVRVGRGKSAWNYKAVMHAYIELAALGITILPPAPDGYAAYAIVQVYESMNLGVPKYIVERHRRPLRLRNEMTLPMKFLSPLIGSVTAQALGRAYGSVYSILTAALEEPKQMQSIPSIGPSTVDKLRKLALERFEKD